MTDRYDWTPLWASLDRAGEQGRKIHVWWRDDDAVEVTLELNRLLALKETLAIPLTLAVIPENVRPGLASNLVGHTGLTVAVHGLGHRNHAPPGERKQELGSHLSLEEIILKLATALIQFQAHFSGLALPMLVPPWNRIAPAVTGALPSLGFSALSTFGSSKNQESVPELWRINTHIDPIDWRGTGSILDPEVLIADLAAQVDTRASGGSDEPLGLLTHHLVHDDDIWRWTSECLAHLARRSAVIWPGSTEWPQVDINPFELPADRPV